MNSRRNFLQMAAVAPAAAVLSGQATMQTAGAAQSLNAGYGGLGAADKLATPFRENPAIRELLQSVYEKQNRRQQWRINGLDHDIYALSSTSLAFKIAEQEQRERDDMGLIERLQKQLWG